jgi:hypothetical protein
MIEFLSKKVIDNFVFYFNFQWINKNYEYSVFYNNLVIIIFSFLFTVEFFFFFW